MKKNFILQITDSIIFQNKFNQPFKSSKKKKKKQFASKRINNLLLVIYIYTISIRSNRIQVIIYLEIVLILNDANNFQNKVQNVQ